MRCVCTPSLHDDIADAALAVLVELKVVSGHNGFCGVRWFRIPILDGRGMSFFKLLRNARHLYVAYTTNSVRALV